MRTQEDLNKLLKDTDLILRNIIKKYNGIAVPLDLKIGLEGFFEGYKNYNKYILNKELLNDLKEHLNIIIACLEGSDSSYNNLYQNYQELNEFIQSNKTFLDIEIENNNIPLEELERNYDLLIEKLNFENENCNLVLNTSVDKNEFKIYKNKNNSLIIKSGEEKATMTITKKHLISVAFYDEEPYYKSYTPIIISKLKDGTIFNQIIDTEKQFENEIKELEEEGDEKEVERVKKEKDIYVKEKNKIEEAIRKLNIQSDVITNERTEAQSSMESFIRKANKCFYAVIAFLILYFLAQLSILFLSNKIDNMGYLMLVFPIVFCSTIGFLFYRQSNIKKNIVHQIDKRIILVHEVKQSLLALVEIYQGRDMEEHVKEIIDKLIENILDNNMYTSNFNDCEKELNINILKDIINGNKKD